MIIREMSRSDFTVFKDIMRQLPEYFDEQALGAILVDLKFQHGFAACDPPANKIAGFVSYFVYEGVLNIGWIAVAREYRRGGVGTLLMDELRRVASNEGITTIQVWTLGDSVDYEPYEKTRAFYYKQGFKEYRRIKTDNPSCPEEMYLRLTL